MTPGRSEKGASGASTNSPSVDHGRRAEIVLKPTPNSVPRARRFVLGLDWAEGASDERLAIVTTEIVTNA
ncbi:MAG: hypothetical protein ACRDZM_14975, partial [Acidimicrobiia bacterium]